ncbi:unnamed protein product [Symbiodinium sp. CCMP2592]|nr:unnamed protein product [Symbiodinium sp. CCMP2592]
MTPDSSFATTLSPGLIEASFIEDFLTFKLVTAVKEHQVVLLSGETGCGKSTQVPQLLLDSAPEARILVMQPRRIAATTLAERIAAERCQALGEDVGYQVPFGSRAENARLVFCTLGVPR